LFQLPEEGDVISWLPSAHIAERALNYYFPLLVGATINTCSNPRKIIDFLPKVRPVFFFAVPRIWEKIKAGREARLASAPADAGRDRRGSPARSAAAGPSPGASRSREEGRRGRRRVLRADPAAARSRPRRQRRRRRGADPARRPGVLPRARHPARRRLGH